MGKDYAVDEESAHFIEKSYVSDRTGFLLLEASGMPCADEMRTNFWKNPIQFSGVADQVSTVFSPADILA
jgi:hypothetical protein